MKIIHVVGARPNFMKMAPVYCALKKYKTKQLIVHTGQHYSRGMSDIFFSQLNIKTPDINLRVGSNTHTRQVADIMVEFEKIISTEKPSLVLVYGDVNSTMAASLVCAKMGIKIGHVEAGLRSRDLSMPEEINRIVTDRLTSLFFTPSPDANTNLLNEGTDKRNIHFVGNVMIDTLVNNLDKIKRIRNDAAPFKQFGIVTLHRPGNVDNLIQLKKIIISFNEIAKDIPLIFPLHPRTRKRLKKIKGIKFDQDRISVIEPLGYLDFLSLVNRAKFVITDSGGIQEETTYLGKPCLTLRSNTERPITVTQGTNTLIGNNFKLLHDKINEILAGKYKKGKIPQKWDGKASERIAKIIIKTNSK